MTDIVGTRGLSVYLRITSYDWIDGKSLGRGINVIDLTNEVSKYCSRFVKPLMHWMLQYRVNKCVLKSLRKLSLVTLRSDNWI